MLNEIQNQLEVNKLLDLCSTSLAFLDLTSSTTRFEPQLQCYILHDSVMHEQKSGVKYGVNTQKVAALSISLTNYLRASTKA